MSRTIQLTNIDKTAVWLDKKGNKINMSELSDIDLQKALEITQNNKVKYFMQFIGHSKREAQLRKEAKNRNATLTNVDHLKPTWVTNKFAEFESVMESLYKAFLKKVIKKEELV